MNKIRKNYQRKLDKVKQRVPETKSYILVFLHVSLSGCVSSETVRSVSGAFSKPQFLSWFKALSKLHIPLLISTLFFCSTCQKKKKKSPKELPMLTISTSLISPLISLQSGFLPSIPTETAFAKAISDIFVVISNRYFCFLSYYTSKHNLVKLIIIFFTKHSFLSL